MLRRRSEPSLGGSPAGPYKEPAASSLPSSMRYSPPPSPVLPRAPAFKSATRRRREAKYLSPPALDAKMLSDVHANFAHLDTNHDGLLSLQEFTAGLGLLGTHHDFASIIFNAFDRSGDGVIDRREFVTAIGVMLHPEDIERQIELAFDAYDLNGDGQLDRWELRSVMGAVFSALCTMGVPYCRSRFSPGIAKNSADELFELLDADHKGYVSRDDYLSLVERQPEVFRELVGFGSVAGAPGIPRRTGFDRYPQRVPARGQRSRRRMERGRSVIVGDSNWELVVQMMLGIRISLAAVDEAAAEEVALEAGASRQQASVRSLSSQSSGASSAFHTPRVTYNVKKRTDAYVTEKLQRHLLEVYKFTLPSHPSAGGKPQRLVQFKDYAPLIFRRLRALFGVAEDDYTMALGPEQILGHLLVGTLATLSELFSEGKSGSFFYFSTDGQYLIKTIPKREASSLRTVLGAYLAHVEAHPDTLLPCYLGFHRITMPGQSDLYFVVMSNVFATERTIHNRYDLKGSYLGRSAGAAKLKAHPDAVRKDLDLKRPFAVGRSRRKAILTQLSIDVEFLRSLDLLDYSLLVGIHFSTRDSPDSESLDRIASTRGGSDRDEHIPPRAAPPRQGQGRWADAPDGGINAVACEGREDEVYFIGIIDILTVWSPAKSLESMTKRILHPMHSSGVSCVPPSKYAARFQRAMRNWFE